MGRTGPRDPARGQLRPGRCAGVLALYIVLVATLFVHVTPAKPPGMVSFVHIPKNGGSTMMSVVGNWKQQTHQRGCSPPFMAQFHRTETWNRTRWGESDQDLPAPKVFYPKSSGLCNWNDGIDPILLGQKLSYFPHSTDVFHPIAALKNTLVIVRDPIERFESAVRWALQGQAKEPQIIKLVQNKINTPAAWARVLMEGEAANPKIYRMLMHEIENNLLCGNCGPKYVPQNHQGQRRLHVIGNEIIDWKYIYAPQHFWINNPTYVVVFDHYGEELGAALRSVGVSLSGNHGKLTKKTSQVPMSPESRQFLIDNYYKKDQEIYEKYKAMKLADRCAICV